jgi:lipid A 4'-phosphatase
VQTRTNSESSDWSYSAALNLLAGSLLVGVIAVVFFAEDPQIDMVIARNFHTSGNHFIGSDALGLEVLRQAFMAFFFLICAVTMLGVCLSRIRGIWSGLNVRKWSYLAICILVGPLAIANLGFKDHWGRARPRDVVELGGQNTYSSPLLPARECTKNCSFVCGEAASIFAISFVAVILFPAQASLLMVAGISLGSFAGLIRMIQGAHFFSDVVFAGVFMGMTVAIVYVAMEALSACRVLSKRN